MGDGAANPTPVGAFLSVLITFTLFEAAYYAEIMRAGIQSIRKGQVAAGHALGMTYWQVMGYIILPQAFRNMLPVLLTRPSSCSRTPRSYTCCRSRTFSERRARSPNRDFRPVEMYLFAAVVYIRDVLLPVELVEDCRRGSLLSVEPSA